MSLTTEERLHRTQAKLTALENEYHDLIYAISHDFSGSLRVISGFAAIINEEHKDSFDERSQRHFQRIIENSEKTKDLLDALLTFSRLNANGGKVEMVILDHCLGQAKARLRDKIEASNAIIKSSNLPIVCGYKNQLTEVFYQLLNNALTYQQTGNQPLIEISAEQNNDEWQLTVKDNGIGVKPKFTEKIIKPLQRIVKSRDYSGAGMGLAIVKKIIDQHHGKLSVSSGDPQGLSVHISLSKAVTDED